MTGAGTRSPAAAIASLSGNGPAGDRLSIGTKVRPARLPDAVEAAAPASTMTRPGHGGDSRTVLTAADAWSVGLDEHLRDARIQRPPAAPAITLS